MLPLYEAKMLHQYDHRWATYDGPSPRDTTEAEKRNPRFSVLPRYWVAEREVSDRLPVGTKQSWLLGWRDVARATDRRTVISSAFPAHGVGDKMLLAFTARGADKLNALLDSLVLDFAARQKVGGTALKYFLVKQFPALLPEHLDGPSRWGTSGTVSGWIFIINLVLT